MTEIIETFLSHPLILLAGFIATMIGGWAAIIFFKQEKAAKQATKNTPKKQYDIFLSYAKPDVEPARKLAEHLKQAGVQVWFDEWAYKLTII